MANYLSRSHYCGDLSEAQAGKEVVIMGWIDSRRDHGGLVFLDVRDYKGIIQVVFDPQQLELSQVSDFRSEYVIAVSGVVRERPVEMKNSKITTGHIEVEAKACELLSEAKTLPFQVDDLKVSETLRLKYRYLEFRSKRMQRHLRLRHRVAQITRNALSEMGFIEVETPILYKSTPEGARDYLVPSRVNPGHFYALPQSPQTLKQLLMIGGVDRYFQLSRCFRDEDLRADRQPEFSQIDIEMSFVEPEDVMSVTEQLLKRIWKEIKSVDVSNIPRLDFFEAMGRYGSDKPDLRNPLELKDIKAATEGSGFKVFDDVIDRGADVRALALPKAALSRAQIDKLTTLAKQHGAKGLVWIKSEASGLQSPISKFVDAKKLKFIFEAAGGVEGSVVFIVADEFETSCNALGALRNQLGRELGLIDETQDRFLWVINFPLLEFSSEDKRWVARHHPFTSPQNETAEIILSGDEGRFHEVKAKAYDLVCNGFELAGGSVRIHNQKMQSALFKSLGMSENEVQEKFGFFIEALQYGTPPHGGIAWGLDRLNMILAGTDAIRDVIAFPKTAKATDLMADAPSRVSQEQLLELQLKLFKPNLD